MMNIRTKVKTDKQISANPDIDAILRHYCDEISRPVDDSHKKAYLPTQLMTYLFKKIVRHHLPNGVSEPIEGIRYSSSKASVDDIVVFVDPVRLVLGAHFVAVAGGDDLDLVVFQELVQDVVDLCREST